MSDGNLRSCLGRLKSVHSLNDNDLTIGSNGCRCLQRSSSWTQGAFRQVIRRARLKLDFPCPSGIFKDHPFAIRITPKNRCALRRIPYWNSSHVLIMHQHADIGYWIEILALLPNGRGLDAHFQ